MELRTDAKEINQAETDLKWLSLTSEQTTVNKFKSKFQENPFVPIGVICTTVILGKGFYSFQKGESMKQQKYMRMRVAAQGLTLLAMCIGGLLKGSS